MSTTVSFSFDNPEEKQRFTEYARSKGMTLSALVKMALYQYRAKYPHKRGQDGGMAKEPEEGYITSKTVQPTRLEDNGSEGAVMNSITMTEEEIAEKEAMNPDSDF